jgi:hypothetical protein
MMPELERGGDALDSPVTHPSRPREAICRVLGPGTVAERLPAVLLRIEHHPVKVHLSAATVEQYEPSRQTRLNLRGVMKTNLRKRCRRARDVVGVNYKVKVVVDSGLNAHQSVYAPTPVKPAPNPHIFETGQNLGHVPHGEVAIVARPNFVGLHAHRQTLSCSEKPLARLPIVVDYTHADASSLAACRNRRGRGGCADGSQPGAAGGLVRQRTLRRRGPADGSPGADRRRPKPHAGRRAARPR